ncbi:MAG TPA: tetratricopeptide repeat protein, partial [Bryobacteraceae bacterium]|nr:tetratricopeptide repeat protein [Bryobacteraceae bacterium]
KRVRESTYGEIVRMIKEEEPPKPSTRLSDSGETLVSISAQRQTEPAKLTRLVRGELDWIVMKCLEKDRNHRYATANGLTHDIEHYLNDEPVQACPPSALYRFRKLARRNKRAFIVASAAALVVVLALVGLSVSNILIRQEQARTREEQERTDKAQKLAQKAQILAQDRAEEVQRGLDGLKAANALLDRGRWHANERDWDDAHAAFTKAVRLRPDHVSVWVERGDLFARLGLWDLAAADFAREPLGRQSGSRV